MKIIVTIAAILFVSCNFLNAQNSKCVREAKFGDAKICLPEINGYTECYNDPIVKELADKTEVAENIVLGFYFNNEVFRRRDSLGYIDYDDYFKVYATKLFSTLEANTNILEKLKERITQNFVKKKWIELSKEIQETGFIDKIDEPILIESYSMNQSSFSAVLLAKYIVQGREPYTMAMTLNGYIKEDRFVWMAYYLNYENGETIERLKKNSNQILEKLINSGE